ncbi:hypothetical protein ACODNH_00845 (plasmid) [Haloarcula sp. NS06]|uniref:hypothetical protein n=1 Tax=Haloarcula sp. NS06 TaxID=3409688 RepID=UPI003DA6D8A2
MELDFNGAWVYGSGDRNNTDIIHLAGPGGRLLEPRINLHNGGNGYDGSNTYNGTVFHLNTQYGSYLAHGTAIRGGHIFAVGGGGTACKLTVSEPGTWITHMNLQYNIGNPHGMNTGDAIGNGVFLDTTGGGDDGWINGVTVNGHWRYPDVGILQDGVVGKYNQQTRNMFNVQIQPAENGGGAWVIRDPTWSERNVLYGLVWDFHTVDDPIWNIKSTYKDAQEPWRACQHNAIHSLNDLRPEHVRNDSPSNHYLGRPEKFSVQAV